MLRCLVIGDSMPLPSPELKYTDTWLYRINVLYPNLHIINRCQRSSSARRLKGEGPLGKDILELYQPDFVITHLGIPDAAPRLLKREALSTKIINHLPFSKYIYNYFRKTRGRTIENCDISTETFFDCFDSYAKRCMQNGIPLFIVEISYGTTVLKISPRFNDSVQLYNQQLHRIGQLYNNATIIPAIDGTDNDDYQLDGIHLSAQGQNKILNNIIKEIKSQFNVINNESKDFSKKNN